MTTKERKRKYIREVHMTKEKRPNLTVISDTDINTEAQERIKRRENVTQPNAEFHTNLMYEKLLKFKETQKKKRFTVEDLLKW